MINLFLIFFILIGCSSKEESLKGLREDVFKTSNIVILNKKIDNLSDKIIKNNFDCNYVQKSNILFKDSKIVFKTDEDLNTIKINKYPVCDENNIYIGLNTGEVVKISKKNHNILWKTEIFSKNSIFGDSYFVDIISPLILYKNYLFVGSLGNAFCKINVLNGYKKWCLDIGTAYNFLLNDKAIFIVSLDNYLYAVSTTDGSVYWRTYLNKQDNPILDNEIIKVGNQKINSSTGLLIK